MEIRALLDTLRQFDTPTICNALEIVRGRRFETGFTRQRLLASCATPLAVVGHARTARLRCTAPLDPAKRRDMLLAYYEYLAQLPRPTVAVIEDVDDQPGLGAFWGEVNTTVHWGLGCRGAVTNGSMRDLDTMCPTFQCLAATLSPSHVNAQIVEFGRPVNVCGMTVADGDLLHADRHGAVVFSAEEAERLPAAVDLMLRRERVILDAACAPGFDVAAMRDAMARSDRVV